MKPEWIGSQGVPKPPRSRAEPSVVLTCLPHSAILRSVSALGTTDPGIPHAQAFKHQFKDCASHMCS